jgi:hypothetical protein
VQWLQYRSGDQFFLFNLPLPLRAGCVALLVLTWLFWGVQTGDSFIYFQF